MKTAVCFEALKAASETKQLTSKEIEMFHEKAEVLSKHLIEQNITALNNKELMKDVLSNLNISKGDSAVKNEDISRLIQLNKEEIATELAILVNNLRDSSWGFKRNLAHKINASNLL